MPFIAEEVQKENEVRESAELINVNNKDYSHDLEELIELVKQIRPAKKAHRKQASENFGKLQETMQKDPEYLHSLQKALLHVFVNTNIISTLTESGILSSRGFLQELLVKFKHRFLPPLTRQDDFLYTLNQIFFRKDDDKWVSRIDKERWLHFFKLLGIEVKVSEPAITKQLNQSLYILSQRTVTLFLEREIFYCLPDEPLEDTCFIALDRAVQNYIRESETADCDFLTSQAIEQIVTAIHKCKKAVSRISEERRKKGTSLSQTYILIRIDQQLERLLLITDLLFADCNFNLERFINYFIQIIRLEKRKYSIREFLSSSISFLAYKITEHGGSRGEKYITTTRREYWLMIKSALGGGFIAAFTATIKNFIARASLAPFWQGFLFSVNYAASFQIMHETHSNLATKQPAFTASAIAGSLDYFKEYRKPDLYGLAIIIARTSRSQIASFFGNLIIVFPTSYLIAFVYNAVTGDFILNEQEAHHMLDEQHPFKSLSLLYACFTGCFLFASGLIAGYVDNGINFGRIRDRLIHHPVFRNTLGKKKLERVTNYIDNNLGALVGNICLGFFLGMAGFFGHIFGLPFDIRHITISAGNASIALFTRIGDESTAYLLTVFAGILLIGTLNFVVSFSLAFYVAVKSRGIRLRDYPEMISVLSRFFVKFPLDFLYAPKTPRDVEEVKRRMWFR